MVIDDAENTIPQKKCANTSMISQIVQVEAWPALLLRAWTAASLLAVDELDADPVRQNDEVCVHGVNFQQVQRSAYGR